MNPLAETLKQRAKQITPSPGESSSETPVCAKCQGFGYWWDENGESNKCECQVEAKKKNDNMRSGEKLKALYSTYDISNYKTTEEWQARLKKQVEDYMAHRGSVLSLLLLGQSGCGKTMLAASAFKEFIRHGAKCECISYVEFMREVSQNIYSKDEFHRLTNSLKKCDMLMIDDFLKDSAGKRYKNTDVSIVFEIIDYRNRYNLPVIITSELHIADMVKFDEAVAGRLVAMAKRNNKNFVCQIKKDPARNWRLRGFVEI